MGRTSRSASRVPHSSPLFFGALLWKGGRLTRWLVLLIAIELALPVATTGFVQRYVYLASAFLACILGPWIAGLFARQRAFAATVLLAVGSQWLWETASDVRLYREAGRVTDRLLQQAGELHSTRAPGSKIAIVNVPPCWGPERDIPLFNWGFVLALRESMNASDLRPSAMRVSLWRTDVRYTNYTNGDVQLVSPNKLQAAIRNPRVHVLEYDPTEKSFREHSVPLAGR